MCTSIVCALFHILFTFDRFYNCDFHKYVLHITTILLSTYDILM